MAAAGPLIGRWRKTGADATTSVFPDEVEFLADGTYRATHAGPGHPLWDEASFDLHGADAVSIVCSNDRRVTYALDFHDAEVTFSAGDERVTYRRMPGGLPSSG